MKRTAALVLSLASLTAQDKPQAPDDLPQFRAAFSASPAGGPMVAIACARSGEPVVLTSGTDAGGKELTRQSLVPLLGLSKVLAADAISAQQKDLDKGSGIKLGGRELSVRELLDGTALLPDYFVLDGNGGRADAAVLQACSDMAGAARMQLGATTLGAAEFVLLEPLAFAGRHKDWPSMLRTSLGPRVPGLDPMSADSLNDSARDRLLLAEDFGRLAAAEPVLLRTVLSLTDLTTWWQWRSSQVRRLSHSARMGSVEPARTNSRVERWTFVCSAMSLQQFASHYPAHKAGLLWIGPRGNLEPIVRAFEADVLSGGAVAPETEKDAVLAAQAARWAAFQRAAAEGGWEPAPAPPAKTAAAPPLGGTRWRSSKASGPALEFAFGEGARAPLAITAGADTVSCTATSRVGDGYLARGNGSDGSLRLLHIWPQLDGERLVKLSVIMVTMQRTAAGGLAAGPMGSAVPQYLELLPEAK